MTNADRLAAALAAVDLRGEVQDDGLRVVAFKGSRSVGYFTRRSVKAGFSTEDFAGATLAPIGRKYAELGVKAFATRRRFGVVEASDCRIVLVNRG